MWCSLDHIFSSSSRDSISCRNSWCFRTRVSRCAYGDTGSSSGIASRMLSRAYPCIWYHIQQYMGYLQYSGPPLKRAIPWHTAPRGASGPMRALCRNPASLTPGRSCCGMVGCTANSPSASPGSEVGLSLCCSGRRSARRTQRKRPSRRNTETGV